MKFSLNSFFGELSKTTPDAADTSDLFLKFKIDLIIILKRKSLLNFIKPKLPVNIFLSSFSWPLSSSKVLIFGQPITDPANKADILNQHFKSVFTVEDRSNIPDKGPSLYPSITDFRITPEGVYNVLSNCNPHKSPGPDAIHPYALQVTATEITPILTHIFQTSLDSGTVPSSWKHAYISPVFKKGDKANPKIIVQFHSHQLFANLWNM